MEPFDLDNLIRQKLEEPGEVHQAQWESARPFVWEAVQRNLSKGRSLAWYHLAAAVLLLMMLFSGVLYKIQQSHRKELEQLTRRIDQMQQDYAAQGGQVQTKEAQLTTLENQLQRVQQQLADRPLTSPSPPQETMVYRTDTVYVTRVEYIPPPVETVTVNEIPPDADEQPLLPSEPLLEPESSTDQAIFLSSSNSRATPPPETIKVTFGAFARKE